MKAVVYNGPRDVSVKNVPDARIEQPNDVIVKITTTNICGSDLHILTMNHLVGSVRFTGGIGIVGIFLPKDPGAADQLAKQGEIAFDMGLFWFKGQSIGTGQANIKHFNGTCVI
jgi:D-arabinose 1-dehydrogenase-like Zn-dependent alcohol dehydrogenase